ncbi:LAMP3 protein, partial [Heliornis fulica]|nr:LAMP3 protein [Heliornis fulica]
HVSSENTEAATNTTMNHTTSDTHMTAAAISTAAPTVHTVKPTTGLGNQTALPKSLTATAMTIITATHLRTQTTIPSTTTSARPTPAPQPSSIPTGTYIVSSRNKTCIKVVMGLQLMAWAMQKVEYVAVNPNLTETAGSCGTAQSELNITFNGGFINFIFVK